jgi:hypothetical protein
MTTEPVYKQPRAAPGLRGAGRKLWRAVTNSFELRPDELVTLEAAARMADELTDMQAALIGASVLVSGSAGQETVNALFRETRSHRLALGRLLAQLGLAEADSDAGLRKSSAGRRLARLRWSRGA